MFIQSLSQRRREGLWLTSHVLAAICQAIYRIFFVICDPHFCDVGPWIPRSFIWMDVDTLCTLCKYHKNNKHIC